nr:unnamed protein product [Digitaria exilis]
MLDVPAVQWVADHEDFAFAPLEEDEAIACVADGPMNPSPRLGEEGEGGVGGSLDSAGWKPSRSTSPSRGGAWRDLKRRRKRRAEATRRKDVQAADARARSAASSRWRKISSSSSSGKGSVSAAGASPVIWRAAEVVIASI